MLGKTTTTTITNKKKTRKAKEEAAFHFVCVWVMYLGTDDAVVARMSTLMEEEGRRPDTSLKVNWGHHIDRVL